LSVTTAKNCFYLIGPRQHPRRDYPHCGRRDGAFEAERKRSKLTLSACELLAVTWRWIVMTRVSSSSMVGKVMLDARHSRATSRSILISKYFDRRPLP